MSSFIYTTHTYLVNFTIFLNLVIVQQILNTNLNPKYQSKYLSKSPKYFLNITPVSSISYFKRYMENPSFKVRHIFLKKLLSFPFCCTEKYF